MQSMCMHNIIHINEMDSSHSFFMQIFRDLVNPLSDMLQFDLGGLLYACVSVCGGGNFRVHVSVCGKNVMV